MTLRHNETGGKKFNSIFVNLCAFVSLWQKKGSHTILFISAIATVLVAVSCSEKTKSPFAFKKTDQGIELLENSSPVFFYQQKPKSLTGQYICSNYIHPLYNLSGDTLTSEFPPDHPFHRGVFWTWHQLFVDNKSIGDGWMNENISQVVVNVLNESDQEKALLKLDVMWKSAIFQDGKPFMNENTTIIVHKKESNIRKIDFEIKLKSLVNGLEIGGSADEKGYGGFCTRIKLTDSLVFTSENGRVTPQNLQIVSGPWMDFSDFIGKNSGMNGITILCHPDSPNYPEPWILRQRTSMQNVVFPGQARISIPMDKPVVLHYRLIVHNGNASSINIPELHAEYSKVIYKK